MTLIAMIKYDFMCLCDKMYFAYHQLLTSRT